MKKKILLLITVIGAFAMTACQTTQPKTQNIDAVFVTPNKAYEQGYAETEKEKAEPKGSYVAGYKADDEMQEIMNLLGNDGIYIFEYDANGYNYVQIYAERYENGERISDRTLLTIGKAEDTTDFSGKIAITINEENMIRMSASTNEENAIMNTDYKNIGAPKEELGNMKIWIDEKEELSEAGEIAVLFVGYIEEESEDGYPSSLEVIDESTVGKYSFCYRVMVKFLNGLPE